MNRTGSKVMIFLVFTENNKNKGPFSSKKVIFSTKIVLALGIRSNKKVPRQPSKIWTLSTRKNRFALWATSAATGRFHQSYPLPLTNPPCSNKTYFERGTTVHHCTGPCIPLTTQKCTWVVPLSIPKKTQAWMLRPPKKPRPKMLNARDACQCVTTVGP